MFKTAVKKLFVEIHVELLVFVYLKQMFFKEVKA